MAQLIRPMLPAPPSWYPGHMRQFQRMLPALLGRTDVVLELRDARLPLTSINRNFEGALRKWQQERHQIVESGTRSLTSGPSLKGHSSAVCERVVVMSKRDLVAEWGIEPFQKAMQAKFPGQRLFFASWNRNKDVKALHEMLVNIAKRNADIATELNILVVGMPNVGKSTILNALRHIGIAGPTAKALRTSAHPGLTRALSTRLKLSQDPLVYAFDSPGVMLPFLGKGEAGAERGVKLALIAGIREGLYDEETLAAYLLYRLNLLNPSAPAYLSLLPSGTPPITELYDLLDLLAHRFGMLKRGGERDHDRAAVRFVKWWREEGSAFSASPPSGADCASNALSTGNEVPQGRGGWGFDFDWDLSSEDIRDDCTAAEIVQQQMERTIDEYMRCAEEEDEDEGVSTSQERKRAKETMLAKKAARYKAKVLSRKG